MSDPLASPHQMLLAEGLAGSETCLECAETTLALTL